MNINIGDVIHTTKNLYGGIICIKSCRDSEHGMIYGFTYRPTGVGIDYRTELLGEIINKIRKEA